MGSNIQTKGKSRLTEISSQYFSRFGMPLPLFHKPPHPDTKITITIPCHNENKLDYTLDSLAQCHLPDCHVEVIILINASESDPPHVISANIKTMQETTEWISKRSADQLSFIVLMDNRLPKKHAGVGLARKIAMDLALQRLASLKTDGAIICLDADCVVKPNYLLALEKHFVDLSCDIATIDFDHRPETLPPSKLKEGIIAYELFLRYYIAGLQFAGFPFAYHTIGSSMGIRASRYALSGGMNRRKAGEDFYFLHKVFPHGEVHNIQTTTVYPSPRTSDRVPFGTGRAMLKWLEEEKGQLAYDPRIFVSLKSFLQIIESLYQSTKTEYLKTIDGLAPETQDFLREQNFDSIWKELKEKTANETTFRKRFFQWCNGFLVLKYVHYLRDRFYPSIPIDQACLELSQWMEENPGNDHTTEGLLTWFRQREHIKGSNDSKPQPNGYQHDHNTHQ